ncbi:DHDH (predicted) [Pycnogonum litorale]
MATVSTSMATNYFCEAFIVGSKGKIKIEYPFWSPTKMTVNDEVFEFKLPDFVFEMNYLHGQGFQYEAAEVRRCLQQGLKESPLMTIDDTELIMSIMDRIRKEIGVIFDADM